jgi:hypothetical protein
LSGPTASEGDLPDEGTQEGLRRDPERALRLLRTGRMEIVGRLVDASNTTLYATVTEEGPEGPVTAACVYKPIRGERPLDDFPVGTLGYREVAAFHVSEASGWGIVPPTVLRDGPYGEGMVQLWIEVDEMVDVLELVLTRDARLRPMALFDAIIENADRKGGHVLPARDGHLYGCDHGVCFSRDPKLRTVLWGWRGEPLSQPEHDSVGRIHDALQGALGGELRELLSAVEVRATVRRAERLLAERCMPMPALDRPVIPWPPF